ncbi:hypothetical protein A2U01_0064092, partial [Trifolium medium]|nr:hypothetical protein [Trifolium medium]
MVQERGQWENNQWIGMAMGR